MKFLGETHKRDSPRKLSTYFRATRRPCRREAGPPSIRTIGRQSLFLLWRAPHAAKKRPISTRVRHPSHVRREIAPLVDALRPCAPWGPDPNARGRMRKSLSPPYGLLARGLNCRGALLGPLAIFLRLSDPLAICAGPLYRCRPAAATASAPAMRIMSTRAVSTEMRPFLSPIRGNLYAPPYMSCAHGPYIKGAGHFCRRDLAATRPPYGPFATAPTSTSQTRLCRHVAAPAA